MPVGVGPHVLQADVPAVDLPVARFRHRYELRVHRQLRQRLLARRPERVEVGRLVHGRRDPLGGKARGRESAVVLPVERRVVATRRTNPGCFRPAAFTVRPSAGSGTVFSSTGSSISGPTFHVTDGSSSGCPSRVADTRRSTRASRRRRSSSRGRASPAGARRRCAPARGRPPTTRRATRRPPPPRSSRRHHAGHDSSSEAVR